MLTLCLISLAVLVACFGYLVLLELWIRLDEREVKRNRL